ETHDELLPHNVGISDSEIPCDHGHLRLQLIARHTRPQPGDNTDVLAAACGLRHQRQRNPHVRPDPRIQIRIGARIKPSGHHSDHGVSISTEQNVLANRSLISAEAALPQRMTQYGNALPVGSIFFGKKVTAERGANTKYLEI